MSKSRRSKIARQVFCAIVGIFDKKAPNLLKETKGEHIMQYIKKFRGILGKSSDVESEMTKLNEAMKLVLIDHLSGLGYKEPPGMIRHTKT